MSELNQSRLIGYFSCSLVPRLQDRIKICDKLYQSSAWRINWAAVEQNIFYLLDLLNVTGLQQMMMKVIKRLC